MDDRTDAWKLSDLLRLEDIVCPMDAAGREEAIGALLERLHGASDGFDVAAARAAVMVREGSGSTNLAPGVALPHARLDGLARPRIAIGVSRGGIPFAAGKPPVHVILLVLSPRSEPGAYLRIVAALMQRLREADVARCVGACESAADILAIFTEGAPDLPPYLSVSHVMRRNPVTLSEADTLADALHAFCTHNVRDIPVIDETGDVRGVVAVEDFLRLSLPEHLLWMQDLSPILHFQPFADVLRKDRETRVADFVREEFVGVAPDLPAIQAARLFLMNKSRQILVVDGRRFLGVIDVEDFVTQLFWA
ncbi:MAG: PTS sugar transporter subunit IIA [Verrucomicrobia bacterium]|nr:PTS sugar transporter subunit IIA [Verrucomicrobiota bacterium]